MPLPFIPWLLGEGTDIIAAALIVFASFFIFFRTREIYELSSHEGIKYFRFAFLFFGVSFLMEMLRPLFHFFEFGSFSLRYHTLFVVVFVGNMAVLCLLYSALWRRMPDTGMHPFFMLSIIALLLAVVSIFSRFFYESIFVQTLLFLLVLIISYVDARKQKRPNALQIHILYTLLFFSWIAKDAADITERRFLVASILLNVIAVALFMMLLSKVLRKTDVGRLDAAP